MNKHSKDQSVKVPIPTYRLARAIAAKRGCFISRVFADALELYAQTEWAYREALEKAKAAEARA